MKQDEAVKALSFIDEKEMEILDIRREIQDANTALVEYALENKMPVFNLDKKKMRRYLGMPMTKREMAKSRREKY
jgi:regulator of replication initiation timing